MFNVLIGNAVDAAPAKDVYGSGLKIIGTPTDIDDLEVGGIALLKSDGTIVQRGSATVISAGVGAIKPDTTFKFQVRTARGLQTGLTLNPRDMSYEYQKYVAPVKHVTKHVVAAPSTLADYIGRYATIRVTDTSQPEYKLTRTREYSILLNEINTATLNALVAEIKDTINADVSATVVVTGSTNTLIYTAKEAGKRITVVAEDVIRSSVYSETTAPKKGTPTADLAELEIRRSSQMGININAKASDLYNLVRSTDEVVGYDIFSISTVNNTGPDKSPTFDLLQTIAIPTACTTLVKELKSLLNYLITEATTDKWETTPA